MPIMVKLVSGEKPDSRELDALWRAIHQRVENRMAASFKRLGFKVPRAKDSQSSAEGKQS
jgi:hypothetical protein